MVLITATEMQHVTIHPVPSSAPVTQGTQEMVKLAQVHCSVLILTRFREADCRAVIGDVIQNISVDIDECLTDQDDCNSNATCANTPGSFVCACLEGFSGDGKICSGKFLTSLKIEQLCKDV